MKSASRARASRSSLGSPATIFSNANVPRAAATLSEKVYRALKRDIIHGVYQPGEALGEKELAEKYKGSRTPVREAAVRLQNERLLRIVPNRGYFVSQITLQVLNDVYEFRAAVESAAAELAAARGAAPDLLDKLHEYIRVTCTPDDRKSCVAFIEADTAFHTTIARMARNQMLLQAGREGRSQRERIMFAAIDIHYYGELPNREHLDILEAIGARDPQKARQRMHDQIVKSKDKGRGLTNAFPRHD